MKRSAVAIVSLALLVAGACGGGSDDNSNPTDRISRRHGTITVTALTATRIAGTFSFDAVPGSGAATGTMQVRNGTFDLTL